MILKPVKRVLRKSKLKSQSGKPNPLFYNKSGLLWIIRSKLALLNDKASLEDEDQVLNPAFGEDKLALQFGKALLNNLLLKSCFYI